MMVGIGSLNDEAYKTMILRVQEVTLELTQTLELVTQLDNVKEFSAQVREAMSANLAVNSTGTTRHYSTTAVLAAPSRERGVKLPKFRKYSMPVSNFQIIIEV